MAHNISPRKMRYQALGQKIGDFETWSLAARCSRCGDWRSQPVLGIVNRFGGDHKVALVLNRLRCRVCQNAPNGAKLVQKSFGREIDLLGAP